MLVSLLSSWTSARQWEAAGGHCLKLKTYVAYFNIRSSFVISLRIYLDLIDRMYVGKLEINASKNLIHIAD